MSPPSVSTQSAALHREQVTTAASSERDKFDTDRARVTVRSPSPGLSFAFGASMPHVVHPFDEFIGHRQVSDIWRLCNVHHFPPAIRDDDARIRNPVKTITGHDPFRVVLLRIAAASHQLFSI